MRKHRLRIAPMLLLVLIIQLAGCSVTEGIGNLRGDSQTSNQLETESENVSELARSASRGGYSFTVEGGIGKVQFTVDEDLVDVTDQLKAPVNYFEAPGCAGDGIEKIYTYSHFVINSYPSGDQDLIASIVLMDDMVATEEGIEIGMTADQVTEAYGASNRKDGDMVLYEKDGMQLGFLISNGKVTSIQYQTENY